MRVLGVDPGLSGAIVLLDMARERSTERLALRVEDMPRDTKKNGRGELLDAQIAAWIREWRPEHAYIERVHSMPAQGVASTFTFGAAYGVVRGVLAGLAIPTTRIDPKDWTARVRMTKATTSPLRRASCSRPTPIFSLLRKMVDRTRR